MACEKCIPHAELLHLVDTAVVLWSHAGVVFITVADD